MAAWARGLLASLDFQVEEVQDPFRLEDDLTRYDLVVLGWTQALTTEDLSEAQERSLLTAVSQGVGVAGWHGMAASFRASLQYSLLIGGSFLEHPGGEATPVPYPVGSNGCHQGTERSAVAPSERRCPQGIRGAGAVREISDLFATRGSGRRAASHRH